jgi:hypothetical protein
MIGRPGKPALLWKTSDRPLEQTSVRGGVALSSQERVSSNAEVSGYGMRYMISYVALGTLVAQDVSRT